MSTSSWQEVIASKQQWWMVLPILGYTPWWEVLLYFQEFSLFYKTNALILCLHQLLLLQKKMLSVFLDFCINFIFNFIGPKNYWNCALLHFVLFWIFSVFQHLKTVGEKDTPSHCSRYSVPDKEGSEKSLFQKRHSFKVNILHSNYMIRNRFNNINVHNVLCPKVNHNCNSWGER